MGPNESVLQKAERLILWTLLSLANQAKMMSNSSEMCRQNPRKKKNSFTIHDK